MLCIGYAACHCYRVIKNILLCRSSCEFLVVTVMTSDPYLICRSHNAIWSFSNRV